MPVAYSSDLRRRVIETYIAKEGSQRQLAQRFKVSLTFVRNLLRHYRQTGKVEAKRRGGDMEPLIAAEHKRRSASIERRTIRMPYSKS
jgi:transposase